MKNKLFVIISVVVVVVLVFWWWSSRQERAEAPTGDDINQDLDRVDINNFDDDFKQVDQDLESL